MVLMGDILEDALMADPALHDTILSVGYLNDMETKGHLFDKYLDTFDIVIEGDGPLTPVNKLLRSITSSDGQVLESLIDQ